MTANRSDIEAWRQAILFEVDDDAVPLLQILSAGQRHFGLQGQPLRAFAFETIRYLLDAGATASEHWRPEGKIAEYESMTSGGAAEAIVAKWIDADVEIDLSNTIWFLRG